MNVLTQNGFTRFPFLRSVFVAILSTFLLSVNPAAANQTVKVGGTGASLGTMKALKEAFLESHPDANIIVLPSLGSGGGIKAISKGAIDIAVAGRPLKEKEKTASLTTRIYGRTPFLFAVKNRNSSVNNISHEDLINIYSRAQTTWPNGEKIFVAFRSERESDTRFIKSIDPVIAGKVTEAYKLPGLYIPVNDQENADFLEKNSGSFGVITLSQLITEKRKLRPLKLGGVAPTPRNVMNGTYPYSKPFYMVTRDDISPVAQKFVDFVFSEKGRNILIDTGHAPPNE